MALSCGSAEMSTPWETRASVILKFSLSKICDAAKAIKLDKRTRRMVESYG
jgi:hypothetical protein